MATLVTDSNVIGIKKKKKKVKIPYGLISSAWLKLGRWIVRWLNKVACVRSYGIGCSIVDGALLVSRVVVAVVTIHYFQKRVKEFI